MKTFPHLILGCSTLGLTAGASAVSQVFVLAQSNKRGTASQRVLARGISKAYPHAQKNCKESFLPGLTELVPTQTDVHTAEAKF